jgi:antiviral defense system Shedu protein SduA
MSSVKDRLSTVLKRKKTVSTRAVLWKIPHDSGIEDVHLKIGRYKLTVDLDEVLETDQPKSELTLDHEEFKSLLKFLGDNYEPFRQGVKAFIPLDRPFEAENAMQIKALFSLPDKRELIAFILKNKIIPEELEAGLRQAQRAKAVKSFEEMLSENLPEPEWQKWFQSNSWVLGSQFVRVLDERHIDVQHISDFLMEAYDGFLDVVEIKRPEGGMSFWASALSHGNYIPSTELTKAVAQATRYNYEVEREANSLKFLERMDGAKTVKPRCILVFGRSVGWSDAQLEAYRILNASYHNLTILTYDHVLARARRIAGLERDAKTVVQSTAGETWDDDIPF